MAELEIQTEQIKINLNSIKKILNNNQKICVVLKANAYGLGAKKICKLLTNDCDYFAVSSAKEYYEIKTISTKPILILDPVQQGLAKLIKSGAELTISNMQNLDKIISVCETKLLTAKIHIAINTGMNRFGFSSKNEIEKLICKLQKTQKVVVLGVFSHYFEANNKIFAISQFFKFKDFCEFFKNNLPNEPIFHLSNSDGVKSLNGFDMARVGINIFDNPQTQALKLKAKIIEIQTLKMGDQAGYNRQFVARKNNTKIAIVSIGYADGLHRNIVKKGYVLINDKRAKIVAICMDTLMVNISNISAKIGDDVIIFGKDKNQQIFVCDVASWCDTINYEILTHISKRVKRIYK